jgi:DNA helicase-2/ATP-dependent DNA helicase PcrA
LAGPRLHEEPEPGLDDPAHLRNLNPAQRTAVVSGIGGAAPTGPLLIIAGAGTGKTKTLAHPVAHVVLNKVAPDRILLLTFSGRAASEMTRRAERILREARQFRSGTAGEIAWSGTFHGIANRLLRLHADAIGLPPSLTILDRFDAADLMNLVYNDLGLARKASRFPTKDTCLEIYSHAVNTGAALENTLSAAFPWCTDWADELKALFHHYVTAMQQGSWPRLLSLERAAAYCDLGLSTFLELVAPDLQPTVIGTKRLFDRTLLDRWLDDR